MGFSTHCFEANILLKAKTNSPNQGIFAKTITVHLHLQGGPKTQYCLRLYEHSKATHENPDFLQMAQPQAFSSCSMSMYQCSGTPLNQILFKQRGDGKVPANPHCCYKNSCTSRKPPASSLQPPDEITCWKPIIHRQLIILKYFKHVRCFLIFGNLASIT